MAKHTATGTELPVFFWGQSYGFSLMETLPAAAAFRVFGVGPLVLFLTMFGLFLCGLWLYEGGFKNITESRAWGRVLTLCLGLLPVWIIWSFKARGGYLSAFILGGLLLRLVTSRGFKGPRACLVGCSVGLLFFAQPLWLVGFLPLLLIPFTRGAGLKEGVILPHLLPPFGHLSLLSPPSLRPIGSPMCLARLLSRRCFICPRRFTACSRGSFIWKKSKRSLGCSPPVADPVLWGRGDPCTVRLPSRPAPRISQAGGRSPGCRKDRGFGGHHDAGRVPPPIPPGSPHRANGE